jgi:hypothetical protein
MAPGERTSEQVACGDRRRRSGSPADAVTPRLRLGMSWGTADFLGGLSARRLPLLAVAVVSQAAGLVLVLGIVAIRGRAPAGSEAVALGLAAGAMGAIGLSALYRALAIGPMGVVAPTAALSGTVPVAWGLLRGDRPGPSQLRRDRPRDRRGDPRIAGARRRGEQRRARASGLRFSRRSRSSASSY